MSDRKRRLTHPALLACIATLATGSVVMAQPLVGDGTLACGGAYTVVAGDTLSALSGRAYGDPQLYGFIADANWDSLGGNPENVAVGMTLTIPCIDASGKVVTAEEAATQASSIQAAIAAARPGDPVHLTRDGDRWRIENAQGQTLARLSRAFVPPEGTTFLRGEVAAVLNWRREDGAEEYNHLLRRDEWEVVLLELVFEAGARAVTADQSGS